MYTYFWLYIRILLYCKMYVYNYGIFKLDSKS